jgi:chitin disaccharide deacetylase
LSRILIVNADDLGVTAGVNSGIVEACRHGIVTSASLMVRRPAAAEAVQLARELPALSLGLHVDLGEWTFDGEDWVATELVVQLDDEAAVAAEVERQLTAFATQVGRTPTHLDSHQHVHRQEPVRTVLARIAARLGVPLRHAGAVRYCGDFYGQDENAEPLPRLIIEPTLIALLHDLPDGVTELCCHPGYAHGLISDYAWEREVELQTLCSAEVRRAVVRERIDLRSFADAFQRPLP